MQTTEMRTLLYTVKFLDSNPLYTEVPYTIIHRCTLISGEGFHVYRDVPISGGLDSTVYRNVLISGLRGFQRFHHRRLE